MHKKTFYYYHCPFCNTVTRMDLSNCVVVAYQCRLCKQTTPAKDTQKEQTNQKTPDLSIEERLIRI